MRPADPDQDALDVQTLLTRDILSATAPLLDHYADADRHDLVNALLAAALCAAEEHFGLEATATHLASVARTWAEKVSSGRTGIRGALN